MQDILLFVVLIIVGVWLVYLGISGLLGYRRYAYIFPFSYGYVTGGVNYGSVPLGIMSLMWALAFFRLSELLNQVLLVTSLGFGLIGLLSGILQPSFLDPHWYRWLDENHKDMMPLLRRDIMEIGYKEWERQTKTQEGLEAWVAEVRRKHNLN